MVELLVKIRVYLLCRTLACLFLFLSLNYGNANGREPIYIGTTPSPYDFTLEAVEKTYMLIGEFGNLVSYHFDDGIPWPEALALRPYHDNVEGGINFRLSHLPDGHKVFLSLTPISTSRDGLAAYRGESDNLELPAEWKGKSFDDPDVIASYTNYCRYMIGRFNPDFMAYGIEVNMLALRNPAAFEKYLILTEQVYNTLKAENPDLPLFLTIYVEDFFNNKVTQTDIINRLLPFTDYIAVSTYPFLELANPGDLPENWFSQLRDLAPAKPFAIAETGFIAEDFVSYDVTIHGTEEWQAEYARFVVQESKRLNAQFIAWFCIKDSDLAWEKLNVSGAGDTAKLFRDTGLINGNDEIRESYAILKGLTDPTVLDPPVAVAETAAILPPAAVPLTVNFIGSASYDTDGNIESYTWDFGDGSASSSISSPSHTYYAPGNYTATLTVIDNDGQVGSAAVGITVENKAPVAIASADRTSGPAGLTVNFDSAASYDPDSPYGTITNYFWDFGDGSTSTAASPSHTYDNTGHLYDTDGIFNATLTVTDDLGKIDTDTISIIISPQFVDQYAVGELNVTDVTGSYTDLAVDDGVTESIIERASDGGFSYLEHYWMIPVKSGSTITLFINAWQSASEDGDNFIFSCSVDGGVTYTDLITISNTTDNGLVSASLPPYIQGDIIIRVQDTDRNIGSLALDTLFVDKLYISTGNPSGDSLTIDIKANGYNDSLIVSQGDNVNVTIDIDPGSHDGENSDWWYSISSYDQGIGSWIPVSSVDLQEQLSTLSQITITNTSNLPMGMFKFSFGIDLNPDGVHDTGRAYIDTVVVTVQ